MSGRDLGSSIPFVGAGAPAASKTDIEKSSSGAATTKKSIFAIRLRTEISTVGPWEPAPRTCATFHRAIGGSDGLQGLKGWIIGPSPLRSA